MRRTIAAIAMIAALLPGSAPAQNWPNIPANSVVGRMGIGTGPAQAIPFGTLFAQLINGATPLADLSVNTILLSGNHIPGYSNSGQILFQSGGPQWTFHDTLMNPFETGTVQSGNATQVTLKNRSCSGSPVPMGCATGDYVKDVITISGSGCTAAGQSYQVNTSSVGANPQVTISGGTFSPAPSAGCTYLIGRVDYGWWRWVENFNCTYFEVWEATNPLDATEAPFTAQDEFIRVCRHPAGGPPFAASHIVGFQYPIASTGVYDWSIAANYVDVHLPQTPKNLQLQALNGSSNAMVNALLLVPNGATPYLYTPTGIKFGIGLGGAPGSLLDVSANAATLPAVPTNTVGRFANADGSATRITADAFAATSILTLRRADTTAASPSAVQSGDVLGSIQVFGYGAAAYSSASRATIAVNAAETWTDTAQGTAIGFSTTANTTLTTSQAMTLFNSGGLSIGNTTDPGTGNLSVTGGISIGTAAKTVTLKQGANGSVGTFICTSGGAITVTNSFVQITDAIIISLNAAGGTVSTAPAINAITASTSFVAKCATNDTSTYNYAIIKNAA